MTIYFTRTFTVIVLLTDSVSFDDCDTAYPCMEYSVPGECKGACADTAVGDGFCKWVNR